MLYQTWLEDWLRLYVKPSTKARTYQKYEGAARKYLLPALGSYEAEALTAPVLQQFAASLGERGLAPNTVNGVISVLKASLKRGVALGVLEREYSDSIVRPKGRQGQVSCFSKEEQRKLEKYILESRRPELFGILLSLYSGLRIGELLALTWEDVDLGKGTITVNKSCRDSWGENGYVKLFDTPKTASSERIIPLPRKLVRSMRELKKREGGKFVVAGRSVYGAQVRSYQRTFSSVLKRLRIPHRGFHALRHTFATRALEVGMDVRTLSELLGHTNPALTLSRYGHSMMEHKREMMNKIGKLFPE